MSVALQAVEPFESERAISRAPKARIATVQVPCANCGSREGKVIASGRDHEYCNTTSDLFPVIQCACGLVYLNPRPASSELSTIYPPNYYAYTRLAKNERSRRSGDSALANLFRARNIQRFRPMVKLLEGQHPPPYRILDVGCGDGTPLNYWREALEGRAETYGVEMNEAAAQIARAHGHAVVAKRIEDSAGDIPRGKMDLVYSSHVIEHVEDPAQFLATARDALAPGGYALIDTPNIACIDFRIFGSHWGGFHFPRHWSLFDAETFRALSRRVGFEVLQVQYLPAPVFWIWSLHSLLHRRFPRLSDRLFPPVEIMTRGSLWNILLLTVFTAVDYLAIFASGACGQMRVLLRRKD